MNLFLFLTSLSILPSLLLNITMFSGSAGQNNVISVNYNY